jgi:Fe-Mn family superoxide dismutase
MVDGFSQLEKIRARNRLIERRIGKKKGDAMAPPPATADPSGRIQGTVRTAGVWFRGQDEAKVDPGSIPSCNRSLELPSLPWPLGALAPVISSRALQYHFSHHHQADIDATIRLIRGRSELADKTLLEIVLGCAQSEPQSALFQRASHAWNHSFFWSSLSPEKQRPTGALRQAMARDFGDYDRFARDFAAAGAELFGSGWLWLTADGDGVLKIRTYRDAGSPVTRVDRCLLAVDLWEHAYYLDHQDRRREYLEAIIDRRLDWRFAHNNFAGPSQTSRCKSNTSPREYAASK